MHNAKPEKKECRCFYINIIKTYFKERNILKGKEGHFIMIKE